MWFWARYMFSFVLFSHSFYSEFWLVLRLSGLLYLTFFFIVQHPWCTQATIDRRSVLARHNPVRTASSLSTPLQVGNGGFAFGADITGMQTFQPFGCLSNWGWKSDPLPTNESVSAYRGVNCTTHGKEIPYDIPDPNLPIASQWIFSNPNRMNLGRVGLDFSK